jgi:hypothetical protein
MKKVIWVSLVVVIGLGLLALVAPMMSADEPVPECTDCRAVAPPGSPEGHIDNNLEKIMRSCQR